MNDIFVLYNAEADRYQVMRGDVDNRDTWENVFVDDYGGVFSYVDDAEEAAMLYADHYELDYISTVVYDEMCGEELRTEMEDEVYE